jgi:hypothetical protein
MSIESGYGYDDEHIRLSRVASVRVQRLTDSKQIDNTSHRPKRFFGTSTRYNNSPVQHLGVLWHETKVVKMQKRSFSPYAG